jgi:hypothetical protein
MKDSGLNALQKSSIIAETVMTDQDNDDGKENTSIRETCAQSTQ